MKRVTATYKNEEFTFRTNDDGTNLFVGLESNSQIRHDSGYGNRRQMRAAIREHIADRMSECGNAHGEPTLGRVSYDWSNF